MPLRYTEKGFLYFLRKFQRRLYRQLIHFETLRTYLPETILNKSEKIEGILNLKEGVLDNIELKDHAEKSCLIGIKAEFELFFYIFCIFMINKILSDAESEGKLDENHQGILKSIQNVRDYYEDFVRGGFKNPKGLFIQKAMPAYGLDRMIRFLLLCGVNMENLLRNLEVETMNRLFADQVSCKLRPFSQVRTAFQVRHAIEHSFSRVGEGFIYKAAKDWEHSTWHRQFSKTQGPRLADRILVDGLDISATAAAMSLIAEELREIWEHFSKSGLSGLQELGK